MPARQGPDTGRRPATRRRKEDNPTAGQTSTGPLRYHGAAAIAAILGVDADTISIWRTRFAETSHPFPPPDVEISRIGDPRRRDVPGWSDASVKKIRKWHQTKDGIRPMGRPTGSTKKPA